MNPSDDELRELFDAVRRGDEASAPAFQTVVDRRPARPLAKNRPTRRALAVAATALAALVTVIGVRNLRRPPEIPRDRIETWKPPTDFLLEPSFTGLTDTLPSLPGPVPDYSSLLERKEIKS